MRIAQITDLHMRHHLPGTAHIPRRKSRLVPDLLRRAVERLRAERPDVVILSGDLLDYPLDRMEDPETLPLGRADLVLVRDILEGLDCPRLVLPGNHDPEPLVAEVFASPLEIDVAGHRVLTFVDETFGHIIHIGQVEIATETKVARLPVVAAQEGMYVLQPFLTGGTVP